MTVSAPSTLWIDVDDLVQHLMRHDRPSGIQRVSFEICQALQQLDGGAGHVRFVRRGSGPRDLITVEWKQLATAYNLTSNPGKRKTQHRMATATHEVAPRTAAGALPARAGAGASKQQILRDGLCFQAQALLLLLKLPPLICAHILARFGRWRRALERARQHAAKRFRMSDAHQAFRDGMPLGDMASPGDSLVVLGSPWMHRDYVQTVRWARDERRMRFALLIYDLVPLRAPEWCDRGIISVFADWHRSVLPLADQVFAISRATAADVVAWAAEVGVVLHNPVQPLRMGTGLVHDPKSKRAALPHIPDEQVPARGNYVLFVSTMEARKNHVLLFRVWRRLLSEIPNAQVPTLVFAGRIGWLVADLVQQLENTNWLNGKIRLVRDPTDDELVSLYQGCQFSVFPSLFEGWGLPVSESLALGQPCVISNRTSLPEAGGDLARYFDPENLEDAYQTIRSVIDDPASLQAWRARVARDFCHVPWSDSATIIRLTLEALEAR